MAMRAGEPIFRDIWEWLICRGYLGARIGGRSAAGVLRRTEHEVPLSTTVPTGKPAHMIEAARGFEWPPTKTLQELHNHAMDGRN